MTLFKLFVPKAKKLGFVRPPAKPAKLANLFPLTPPEPLALAELASLAGGIPENEKNPACFICGNPVEQGTVGTGALAGKDLHMDCYSKQYPNGHPLRRDEK